MDGKWSIDQTKRLFDLVSEAAERGEPLSGAFAAVSADSGKSLNSVRAYYYAQLRLFTLMPDFAERLGIKVVSARREEFELFTAAEIDELVERVLLGKAEGKSVRAVIAEMAGGDAKKALRLQNKYRSTVASHPGRIKNITLRLAKKGCSYYDPYLKRIVNGETDDSVSRLVEYIGSLDADRMVDVVKLLLTK